MTPRRIQRKRLRGWKMPPNTVSVTRPGPYGNPFAVGEVLTLHYYMLYGVYRVESAAQAVDLFRRHLIREAAVSDHTVDMLLALRGKNLACFCPIDQPCHADVLLEFANEGVRGGGS